MQPLRDLARSTLSSYSRHGGRMLAAAVAFSSLLSMAPVLVIALHVAGLATGEERARTTVTRELGRWIGEAGARTLGTLLDRTDEARATGAATWASFFSGVVLVYASTRLFSQLKRALNHMWDVQARSAQGVKGKVWKQARKRALAFFMVLVVGVVIVGVVIAETLLASATRALGDAAARAALHVGESALSLGTTTLLFAAVFKVMPDARMAWRDAWRGAALTAILFALGSYVLGLYLGHKALDAMYGPAGSVVLLLLWMNYSAQAFFIGAALTGELARASGREITPDEHGVRIRVDAD